MNGIELLAETTKTQVVPVMNKVTAMTSGVGPKHQLTGAWERFGASADLAYFMPWAPEIVADALLTVKTMAEATPKSELRQELRKRLASSSSTAGAAYPPELRE